MTITAPFRFSRINRMVWFPTWGNLVSHDVPFADGFCGEINLSITTLTPLLIGSRREKPKSDAPTAVYPFVDEDGKWAIPGSSLQGVIRQILEVASFGKLGPVVFDRRFGIRDLSETATAKKIYRDRLVNKVRTGWLVRSDFGPKLFECDSDRIDIDGLAQVFGASDQNNVLEGRSDAKERYDVLLDKRDLNTLEFRRGDQPATLVLTGKTSAGITAQAAKKKEFVFYNKSRSQVTEQSDKKNFEGSKDVPSDTWRDFLLIHEAEKGSGGKENPNWTFWKQEFREGRPVPVFFLEEEGCITAIGMAQMFKLAMKCSTQNMLNNSTAKHDDRESFDLPSLIFGATGGKGGKNSWFRHNLKRRASFDTFRHVTTAESVLQDHLKHDWQVLLAPKPSYYPIYVRQLGHPNNHRPYSTFHNISDANDVALKYPELSGIKIWPATGEPRPQTAPNNPHTLLKIASHLRSVPAGQVFKGSVRVHNLRRIELGALLWALTFGEKGKYVHRLGGAKPIGFGAIRIDIDYLGRLEANKESEPVPTFETLIADFENVMAEVYGKEWATSSQILALKKAASPDPTTNTQYIDNGYQGYKAKREAGEIFGGYCDQGHEIARPSIDDLDAVTRAEQNRRLEEQKAEREQRVAEQPHLIYQRLVEQEFSGRQSAPPEPHDFPEADAFEIGQRVTIEDNRQEMQAIVVGYPSKRAHPNDKEQKKAKWVVGFMRNNQPVVAERTQGKITKSL